MKIHPTLVFSPLLLLAACTQTTHPLAHIPSPTEQLDAQLNSLITPDELSADNQSFQKVLRYITEQNNLNMVVNWPALKGAGLEITTPVTITLHHVTLAAALSTILAQSNTTAPLDFANVDGVLHLSTKADLAANFRPQSICKAYDVRDLLTLPTLTGPTDKTHRMIYLIDLITNHIYPNTWQIIQYPEIPPNSDGPNLQEDHGGNSITNDAATGEGVISAFNSSIIISQTPMVQNEIADLLNQLRNK